MIGAGGQCALPWRPPRALDDLSLCIHAGVIDYGKWTRYSAVCEGRHVDDVVTMEDNVRDLTS